MLLKAHVGLLGNELADKLAKWAAFCDSDPESLISDPRPHSITIGKIPLISKVPPQHLHQLVPHHWHASIRVGDSYDWFKHSSWFIVLYFKWVSGLIHIPHYPSYDQLSFHDCHLCDALHPLKPQSILTFCNRAEETRNLFFDSWGPFFGPVVKTWINQTTPG